MELVLGRLSDGHHVEVEDKKFHDVDVLQDQDCEPNNHGRANLMEKRLHKQEVTQKTGDGA